MWYKFTMPEFSPLRLAMPPWEVRCGIGRHGPGTERFILPSHWQLHIYQYTAEVSIGPHQITVTPGSMTLLPPGVPTAYRFTTRIEHVYAHFRLSEGDPDATLPQVVENPPEAVTGDLQDAILWQHERPILASACLWRLLWRLAIPLAAKTRPDTALRAAITYLEAHLGEPLRVAEVAAATGISHNQLIRIFRTNLGTTPLAWLQRRRADTAAYLIRATDRSLGSIAAEVGLPDRQHFNKVIRRRLGCAPSRLREAPPQPRANIP